MSRVYRIVSANIVRYVDVRDVSVKPYRWPCLQLVGTPACGTTCAKRELMTAEDLEAEEREFQAAIKRASELLAAGKCAVCEQPIEPTTVVGRCKYGACGHRIGQVA